MSTVIRQQDLIESIADALQYISYYHPLDFIQAMERAYEREANPAAKDAIAQILINSRMCAQGHRPICQDTGALLFFVDYGPDFRQKEIEEAAKAGVTAVVQPGGSIRDDEVIRRADELGVAMLFTGQRHFRH